MGKLYFGKPWKESGHSGLWFPFDTDQNFSNLLTVGNNCNECMKNLYEQLLDQRHVNKPVNLGFAFDCWKPVITLPDIGIYYEAAQFLADNQDDFLPDFGVVFGKIGGDAGKNQALILYADTHNRDVMLANADEWRRGHYPRGEAFASRACIEIHRELFGHDFDRWEKEMFPDPAKVEEVLKRIYFYC